MKHNTFDLTWIATATGGQLIRPRKEQIQEHRHKGSDMPATLKELGFKPVSAGTAFRKQYHKQYSNVDLVLTADNNNARYHMQVLFRDKLVIAQSVFDSEAVGSKCSYVEKLDTTITLLNSSK